MILEMQLCTQHDLWFVKHYFVCLFLFIYLYIYLFYFWLHWVFVAAHRPSLVGSERGLLFVAVLRLLIAVASHVEEHGL